MEVPSGGNVWQRLQSESGIVLPLVALTLLVMVLVAALTTEIGAAILQREHLQTAVDAAALAGALNAEPWLAAEVLRSRLVCQQVADQKGNLVPSCSWSYETVQLTGRQSVLTRSWAAQAGCDTGGWTCTSRPQVIRRWITFPSGTAQVVTDTFWANVPSRSDLTVSPPQVRLAAESATVTVSTTAALRTHLLRVVGIPSLPLQRVSTALAQLRSPPWP